MPYRVPPLEVELEPIPSAEALARWKQALELLARVAKRLDAETLEEAPHETPDIRNAPPTEGAPVSE